MLQVHDSKVFSIIEIIDFDSTKTSDHEPYSHLTSFFLLFDTVTTQRQYKQLSSPAFVFTYQYNSLRSTDSYAHAYPESKNSRYKSERIILFFPSYERKGFALLSVKSISWKTSDLDSGILCMEYLYCVLYFCFRCCCKLVAKTSFD